MKTIRIKTLVLLVFVLTLGAGVVAGLLAARLPASGSARTQPGDSPLGEELALTADQREKMKTIWEGVRNLTDDCVRKSSKAQFDRDEKIFAMIPREKVAQYNAIKSDYDNAVAAFQGSREKAFADAVKKTREILSPDQREKYDKILKKRLGAEFGGAGCDRYFGGGGAMSFAGIEIGTSQVTYRWTEGMEITNEGVDATSNSSYSFEPPPTACDFAIELAEEVGISGACTTAIQA